MRVHRGMGGWMGLGLKAEGQVVIVVVVVVVVGAVVVVAVRLNIFKIFQP